MAKVTQFSPEQGGPDRRRIHLREISDIADAPLETVGQDLRAARTRKGEDLASVSRALKIRKGHIEALEESNFAVLPGRTYALGFIRSYASYLGLEPARFVERFKAETAGRWGEDASKLELSQEPEQRLTPTILVLAVLLVAAAAYGVYYVTVTARHMLATPVAAVPARLTAAPPAPAPPPAETTVTPALAPAPEEALPAGQTYGARNADSRVTLRLHAPAKILVQGPGNTVYLNRTLAAGDIYRAPNMTGVTVTTPDSGAIEIMLDGTSLGFLGAKGAIAEGLSLAPQDVQSRYPKDHAG